MLNIGGIANVTVLSPGAATVGFDTGPGNCLLDAWIRSCRGQQFDAGGEWGAGGDVLPELLESCLEEPFFALRAPKSTGRELFNMTWLQARLVRVPEPLDDRDVQATLAELTARTVADAVTSYAPSCERIIVCGGGSHNAELLSRLGRITGSTVETTADHGIAADWIEGATFAWLACARLENAASNVPTVTGARKAVSLGGVYSGMVYDRASQGHE